MSEEYDLDTGELGAVRVSRGPMPPEIARAILQVMRETKQLGFDEKNPHGGYAYASIDKFLSALRPLCAAADLIIVVDEIACEFRAGPENREGRQTSYAFPTYHIWLVHGSGTTWGPLTRRLALPATGPQTFGAAESYVLKRFMRNLFQVPTGEKDADELAEGAVPLKSTVRTPEEDEVRADYVRLSAAIDDCQSAEEVNRMLLHSGLRQKWESAMKKLYPDKYENVAKALERCAERRKTVIEEGGGR